jgi:hypothetical protein
MELNPTLTRYIIALALRAAAQVFLEIIDFKDDPDCLKIS